ncbi:MAG: hypothetical protein LCH46_07255 [Proteobacteria bacterium]|nr:hypothetical protein [Pseudomonadota bacterium]
MSVSTNIATILSLAETADTQIAALAGTMSAIAAAEQAIALELRDPGTHIAGRRLGLSIISKLQAPNATYNGQTMLALATKAWAGVS